MTKRIEVANIDEKPFGTTPYLFRFGVIGTTNVLAYGYCLESALEAAAEYLLEAEYFGHITPHAAPQEDLCCDCDDPYECDSHTYTEAGWLTSYEWHVDDISREELIVEFADKPVKPLRGIGHLGY